MILKGAVINFLGDSITQGVGASAIENRFTDVLEREFELKKANNYGISGSRIARQKVMSGVPSDRDYCMRMEEMDEAADAVVVFGGTNDYGHGQADIGTPNDRTPETFYGACHYLMNGLLDRFCGKPILILTPLHRTDEDNPKGSGSYKPEDVAPLKEYRRILMEVAQFYALPVLDLYAVSGIQPENKTCMERLLPDGLHPSDEGHRLIAMKIGNFLKTL
ncbi:MAG: SGNH/GDSL hydrolase family protein [Clostridia bacterium]|nr:SGNH/GDSL hydrolase family protein [Clostridia bacterium]